MVTESDARPFPLRGGTSRYLGPSLSHHTEKLETWTVASEWKILLVRPCMHPGPSRSLHPCPRLSSCLQGLSPLLLPFSSAPIGGTIELFQVRVRDTPIFCLPG